MNSVRCP